MTTLLQRMNEERTVRMERLRLDVREELRRALRAHTGRFTDASDVDLALVAEPAGLSVYQLIAELSERLGPPCRRGIAGREPLAGQDYARG